MDFFAQQDSARKSTGLLLIYFSLAVALTILLVYFIPVCGWSIYTTQKAASLPHQPAPGLWYPQLFLLVSGATLAIVIGGALYKIAQLRSGGGRAVAEMLGGRRVRPETDDFFEKRLHNVVEEMAIASGVPVPPVYVMEREQGINAFAAGFRPSDSVVAVTYGTMTGLTRDELQGVVAHEFSHILNSDMRINLNLMGFLHGLLVIGLTGRVLLELGFYSSGSRRNRDSGQTGVAIAAAGVTLLVVGFAGYFFCKLIKASISRHRERLADASAVQFTRNPEGLAGALKKIGGLSEGSRIRSPNAEQASHMYFGNGMGASIFHTHPPLEERVKWLEPSFDGTFERITVEELQQQLVDREGAPAETKAKKTGRDIVDVFTRPAGMAATTAVLDAATPRQFKPNNPEALISSIGAPMEQHADAARKLLDSIPEEAKNHARDPYGARMLIYFLLLDSDETVRSRQMALIKEKAEGEVTTTLEKALPNMGAIRPEMRLPLVDLAIPSLRFLSPAQYTAFRGVVQGLIEADNRVDLFEYALKRVLFHHLDPILESAPRKPVTNYYAIRGLEHETAVILSLLARRGSEDPDAQAVAFRAGADALVSQKVQVTLLDESECGWDAVDKALDKLNECAFKVKKWLLGAALACLMQDQELTIEEVELFRAMADTLDCPVPPWVVPSDATATDIAV